MDTSPQKLTSINSSSHDDTKKRLVEAGLEIFSRYNFEGASTRMLAEKAGVNLAAISYHFGGKDGLYLATVQYLINEIQKRAGPLFSLVKKNAPNEAAPQALKSSKKTLSKYESFEMICFMINNIAKIMLCSPEARFWQGILLREEREPTPAFEILYKEFFGPIKDFLSKLVGDALGRGSSHQKVMITTVTIFGQLTIFRIARELIIRSLNWEGYSEKEVEIILDTIFENIRSTLKLERTPIPTAKRLKEIGGQLEHYLE